MGKIGEHDLKFKYNSTYKMSRFYYFCKHVGGGSRYGGELVCLRVPESDHRVSTLTKMYSSRGIYIYQTYPYMPTKKEEIFQIQMRLRAWNNTVTVESPEEAAKKPGGLKLE
jgi:hypothetical protein